MHEKYLNKVEAANESRMIPANCNRFGLSWISVKIDDKLPKPVRI
jgi:hypothetical protein